MKHQKTCKYKQPSYYNFRAAWARCNNPKNNRFKYYGARGIKFKFSSFDEFISFIGPPPFPGATLDRIDVNGHYEPGNIRWLSKKLQGRNTSRTKLNSKIVKKIRKEYRKYSKSANQKVLAQKYGVDRSTVGYVVRGDLWDLGVYNE